MVPKEISLANLSHRTLKRPVSPKNIAQHGMRQDAVHQALSAKQASLASVCVIASDTVHIQCSECCSGSSDSDVGNGGADSSMAAGQG